MAAWNRDDKEYWPDHIDIPENDWLFTVPQLRNSVSVRSGIERKDELARMDRMYHFMRKFVLPNKVTFLAMIYLQRYYQRVAVGNVESHPHIVVVMIFLASRVLEKHRSGSELALTGARIVNNNPNISEHSRDYWAWKDGLLKNELLVMDKLCCDFAFYNPFNEMTRIMEKNEKNENEMDKTNEDVVAFWDSLSADRRLPDKALHWMIKCSHTQVFLVFRIKDVMPAMMIAAAHFYNLKWPKYFFGSRGITVSITKTLAIYKHIHEHSNVEMRKMADLPTFGSYKAASIKKACFEDFEDDIDEVMPESGTSTPTSMNKLQATASTEDFNTPPRGYGSSYQRDGGESRWGNKTPLSSMVVLTSETVGPQVHDNTIRVDQIETDDKTTTIDGSKKQEPSDKEPSEPNVTTSRTPVVLSAVPTTCTTTTTANIKATTSTTTALPRTPSSIPPLPTVVLTTSKVFAPKTALPPMPPMPKTVTPKPSQSQPLPSPKTNSTGQTITANKLKAVIPPSKVEIETSKVDIKNTAAGKLKSVTTSIPVRVETLDPDRTMKGPKDKTAKVTPQMKTAPQVKTTQQMKTTPQVKSTSMDKIAIVEQQVTKPGRGKASSAKNGEQDENKTPQKRQYRTKRALSTATAEEDPKKRNEQLKKLLEDMGDISDLSDLSDIDVEVELEAGTRARDVPQKTATAKKPRISTE